MNHIIQEAPGRTVVINKQSFLYFGGTSYLGMQTHPELQRLLFQNIKKYGLNHGASRKANMQLAVYQKAEDYLKEITHAPDCLTVSSGYLAGQLVANYFSDEKYERFYMPRTHGALQFNNSRNFETLGDLEKAVEKFLNSSHTKTPVLLFDSIDFESNSYPEFEFLRALPLDEFIIIVDDSHGMGITGDDGNGIYRLINSFHPKELVVTASLGKALAVQAGMVLGSSKLLAALRQTEMYGGSSPCAPAYLASFIEAGELYQKQRKRLCRNIDVFWNQIKNKKSFSQIPRYPVFGFRDDGLVGYLKQNGIIITHFRYPNDESPMVSKIVISAHHKRADIDKLVNTINRYFNN